MEWHKSLKLVFGGFDSPYPRRKSVKMRYNTLMSKIKTSPIWKMAENDFRTLVVQSKTITEILSAFGLKNKGNNAKTLDSRIKLLGINVNHIPRGYSAGSIASRRAYLRNFPNDRLFVVNSRVQRGAIKRRIISDNLIEQRCSDCGLEHQWNGKPLVLVLDHINGISNDNRLSNLRFLCPNCNSQTNTFAGRNRRY